MLFVFFLETAQDRHRIGNIRLADKNGLEPARQRGILFDMLAVFIQRGRPDTMQFTARQGRLEQVRGVHGAIALAGTDQRVHLVDEQDDVARSALHFGQDGLEALLEFAAIFRACNQGTHVERHQLLVFQRFGHVAIDDSQRQPFGDGGLADAGLADQHGIVLGAPRQDLDRAADFLVTPDHRVKPTCSRISRQVARIALERIITLFGRRRIGSPALAQAFDRLIEGHRRNTGRAQDFLGLGGFFHRQCQQGAFDGHERITSLLRQIFSRRKNLGHRGAEIELAIAAFNLGQRTQSGSHTGADIRSPATRAFDKTGRQAFFVVDQDLEQVFGQKLLMALRQGKGLCGLDKAAQAFRIAFDVHSRSPSHGVPHEATRWTSGSRLPFAASPLFP